MIENLKSSEIEIWLQLVTDNISCDHIKPLLPLTEFWVQIQFQERNGIFVKRAGVWNERSQTHPWTLYKDKFFIIFRRGWKNGKRQQQQLPKNYSYEATAALPYF